MCQVKCVKCVILVPCQESPLTQKSQGNLSHHLQVFMVLSLTLRSLTDLELVLCGLCYQMNIFSLHGQMEKQILTKRPSFPTPCTATTLKEKKSGGGMKVHLWTGLLLNSLFCSSGLITVPSLTHLSTLL